MSPSRLLTHRVCLFCFLACALQAQTPTIKNVRALHVGKGYARIYWETTEALNPGSATTLTSALNSAGIGQGDTINVVNGANFKAGTILKIEREYMLVTGVSGTRVNVARGYDFAQHQVTVVAGSLRDIVVAGNAATATTIVPHTFETGQRVQVTYTTRTALDGVYALTVTSPTSFTFNVANVPAGTYDNQALTIRATPETHPAGAVVNVAANDSTVCYGTTAAYGQVERAPQYAVFVQTYAHYVGLGGLLPGTTYHARVMSTPAGRPVSDCSKPGQYTAVSDDFTFTTLPNLPGSSDPALPDPMVNFDTSMPMITGTSITVANNCSNLQSAINSAAAADGNLNHEIRIPANAQCKGNWSLPRKTGANPDGSGWIVIRTAAPDSELPPEGVRLRGDWYSTRLPKLLAPLSGGVFSPIFRMANKAHHYRLMGLDIAADPQSTSGSGVILVNAMSDLAVDYLDPTNVSSYLIIDRTYIHGQDNSSSFVGVRLACNYCAVLDSEITNLATRAGEGGAVQLDNSEGPIRIINNKLEGSSIGGFFASDNGTVPGKDVSNVVFQRNYITKSRGWKINAPEYATQVEIAIATATNENPVRFTTSRDLELNNNDSISFSGGQGGWAALNAREILASTGDLVSIVVSSKVATVTTVQPHLLSVGQRIRVNGLLSNSCLGLNRETTIVAVPSDTTFTFATTVNDNSFCNSPDAQVMTVFRPTRIDGRTFTIPVDGSSFGPFAAPSLVVRYGKSRIVKNTFEIKAGRRFLIEGNVIEHSYSQDQDGYLMVVTVRGGDKYLGWPNLQECTDCQKTIQDILVRNNVFTGGCTWFQVLGDNTNGPTNNLRRLKFSNNLVTDIGAYWRGAYDGGSPAACYGSAGNLNRNFEDITLDHNTVVVDIAVLVTSAPPGTLLNLTNNIFRFGNRGISNDVRSSGAAAWQTTVVNNHKFERNIMWGDRCAFRDYRGPCQTDDWGFQKQYYNGVTEGTRDEYNLNYWPLQDQIGFAGAMRITSATNTTPIVVTVNENHGCATGDRVLIAGATGNDTTNGFWTIRVTAANSFELMGSRGNGTFAAVNATALPLTGACTDFRLNSSSPFAADRAVIPGVSGPASDGKDLGADIDEVDAAIGKVTLEQVVWNPTQAEFRYTAQLGETCYVDISSDNFATFTRTADNPSAADRRVVISGLNTANAAYAYHLQCRSFQFSGSSSDKPAEEPARRPRRR